MPSLRRTLKLTESGAKLPTASASPAGWPLNTSSCTLALDTVSAMLLAAIPVGFDLAQYSASDSRSLRRSRVERESGFGLRQRDILRLAFIGQRIDAVLLQRIELGIDLIDPLAVILALQHRRLQFFDQLRHVGTQLQARPGGSLSAIGLTGSLKLLT